MRSNKLTILILTLTSHCAFAAPVACLIEPYKVAEVGASSIGIIEKIMFERGDFVREGQTIALLKADVERAAVGVASLRSQAEAEFKAAIASHDLALAKLSRTQELFDVGFVSKDALDQAAGEARVSKNRVLQVKEGQIIAKYELALSNSQLAQRKIHSPFSGIIVDRYRTEGERVEREPIFRIAKINPLKVEVMLPVVHFGHVKMGTTALIKTDVPGIQDLTGTVTLVDTVVDAASNTFRVRLNLPNPDFRIPAGLRCKADFGLALPSVSKQSTQQKTDGLRHASTASDGVILKKTEILSIK